MESDENDEDLRDGATGDQSAPAEMNSAEAHDAAGQLQESFSRFVQSNQRNHETLSRQMDNPLDRVSKLEQKIEDVRRETQKNRDLIRNYRN
jgi:predicted  nucleic acid-binding Zn-ribbon protein